jgi:hypothetical protein
MPPNLTLLQSPASLRAGYGRYAIRMISHLP